MTDRENEALLGHDGGEPFPQDQLQHLKNQRSVENDVVPEAAAIGRNLGWGSAYILVISRVIGSGIFAMPGNIVQNVGSPGLALLLWVVGSLLAWAGFAVDLEYGCMLPRSGGAKVYLEYTYRWPRFLASTLVAVQAVLLGFTANNCIVFAKYTIFATGQEPSDWNTKLLAMSLLTAITVVHSCFYKTGIRIQNVLGWIKVALITFMIFTGLFVTLLRPSNSDMYVFRKGLWDDSDWAWNNVSTALFKVFYSYAGLNNLNNVLNEVKNPVRTLKSVGATALLTSCFLYILVNVAYLLVVPLEEIKESRELIAALFFERVFGAGFGNVVLPLAIALSAVGNVMVVTFSLVRIFSPTAFSSNRPGAAQPRSRPPGFPPVFQHSRVFQTLRSTHGRIARALRAICAGDRPPSSELCVQLHRRCGRVCASILRPCPSHWVVAPSPPSARAHPPIPRLASGHLASSRHLHRPYCGAPVSARKGNRGCGFLLCYLRFSRHCYVCDVPLM
jgi:L-asparagine transporter-like permease